MLDLLPRAVASMRLLAAEASKPDPLTTREQALISLALAMSSNDADLVRRQVLLVKQNDVTNEEIGHVAVVVGSFALRRIPLIEEAIAGTGAHPSQASSAQQACCR